MTDRARFRLVAGATPNAAIGAIDLTAPDALSMDRAQDRLGVGPLEPGAVGLRPFGEVDTGIAARWSGTTSSLFPHAGPAVLEGVRAWLVSAGLVEDASADPMARYPESADLIEACALDAIARADSPLVIDAVLAQRDLWRAPGTVPEMAPAEQRRLDHLLRAPVVALVGAPNIGKSALTNAMARRSVAVVADEPGTTRDHVGVTLDLGGLTVRWVDTPGIRAAPSDGAERIAIALAHSVIESADLVLECTDASAPHDAQSVAVPANRITVVTRADLAPALPHPPGAVVTSALTGDGLVELARRVREALVQPELLDRHARWRFHQWLP